MYFVIALIRFQNLGMKDANREGLFRQQAIQAISQKTRGRPICVMPRPWLWLHNGRLLSSRPALNE